MAYTNLRRLVGTLLLVAGVLKWHEVYVHPAAPKGIWDNWLFLIGLVAAEVLLGAWVLLGLHPRQTRGVLVACFGAFLAVALSKALGGELTCGCLGAIRVHPWVTTLLDGVVLWCLLCARMPVAPEGDRAYRGRLAGFGIVALSTGTLSIVLANGIRPAVLSEEGGKPNRSGIVILDTLTWIGKRCPVLNHIDIAGELRQGSWIVLLYRHGCPHCREALRQCEEWSRKRPGLDRIPRIALIEVPPFENAQGHSSTPPATAVCGRLDESRWWVVDTPLFVHIRDGIVHGVHEKFEAAERLAAGMTSSEG